MNTNKKAVELTMNTIITSIIVLIVLVLLAYLVINQFGLFNSGTTCFQKQGRCMEQGECGAQGGQVIDGDNLCGDSTDECCKLGSET